MKKPSSIGLVGVVILLATATFSHAAPAPGGHGLSGHPETRHGHPGFEGHHDFDRTGDGGAFIGVPFDRAPGYPDTYSPDYTDTPPASTYWYYCPSYGAYYPTVPSCPDTWVPVPAQ